MKLFRNMSESEVKNSRRSFTFGYFVFLFLLAINSLYHLMTERDLLSSYTIFTAGILLTFGYEFFLNVRKKAGS